MRGFVFGAILCGLLVQGCGPTEPEERKKSGDYYVPPEEIPPTPPEPSPAVQMTAGTFHTCALTESKNIYCWGENKNGQLGNGTNTASATPVWVSAVTEAVQVEAGAYHTCAITKERGVKCWGLNTWGQLGDGTYTSNPTPVQVSGLTSGVRSISAGNGFSCAVKDADGSVVCWGLNNFGQIGNNQQNDSSGPNVPAEVLKSDLTKLTGVQSLDAGGTFVCVTKAGAVSCWGDNGWGELGLGTASGPQACYKSGACAKTAMASMVTTGALVVTGAQYSACALLADKTVKCWGDNRDMQLGSGDPGLTCTVDNTSCSPSPRTVEVTTGNPVTGATELMAGTFNGYYCATVAGKVQCWGGVTYSALGEGVTATGPTVMTKLTAGLAKLTGGFYHACGIQPDGEPECWGRNVEGELGIGDLNSHDAPVTVPGFKP